MLAPRSRGPPGTSVRVTLHIFVWPPGPWSRASLSAPGHNEQESLSGKGGQAGAWVRVPRAVSALPPADLRQSLQTRKRGGSQLR